MQGDSHANELVPVVTHFMNNVLPTAALDELALKVITNQLSLSLTKLQQIQQ